MIMEKYRVQEFNGEFTIFVKTTKKERVWLFKKVEKEVYVRANVFGFPYYFCPHIPTPDFCKSFNTLEEAKEKINIWKKGIITHEID